MVAALVTPRSALPTLPASSSSIDDMRARARRSPLPRISSPEPRTIPHLKPRIAYYPASQAPNRVLPRTIHSHHSTCTPRDAYERAVSGSGLSFLALRARSPLSCCVSVVLFVSMRAGMRCAVRRRGARSISRCNLTRFGFPVLVGLPRSQGDCAAHACNLECTEYRYVSGRPACVYTVRFAHGGEWLSDGCGMVRWPLCRR